MCRKDSRQGPVQQRTSHTQGSAGQDLAGNLSQTNLIHHNILDTLQRQKDPREPIPPQIMSLAIFKLEHNSLPSKPSSNG